MKFLYFIVSFLYSFALTAQGGSFSGFWTGYLTQEEGGYRPKYRFELTIDQTGSTFKGISFYSVDKLFAEMKVEGNISENTLQFKETGLARHTQAKDISWCLKWGELKRSQRGRNWVLEGSWQGKSDTGPCIPGKIYLVKRGPRA